MKTHELARAVLMAVVAFAVLALPTTSGADDGTWRLRIGGAWVAPDFSYEIVNDEGLPIHADADSDFGLGLGLEYMVSNRLGLELGLVRAQPETTLTAEPSPGNRLFVSDGLRFTSYQVGLNVHLTPAAPVDVSVGPVVARVIYGNLTFLEGTDDVLEIECEGDWAYGVNLGADLRIGGGPWSLGGAVTYLSTDLVAKQRGEDERVTIDFDPMIYSLSVGYRF